VNLQDAEALLLWMRQNGVAAARIGDIALSLAEEPATPILLEETLPPTERPADPLDDPKLFGGPVPNFKVEDPK